MKYIRSGSVHIAYQVIGDGPLDLLLVHGWVSNLEFFSEEPTAARFLDRLTAFARVIQFDKRGTGLSDRVSESELPTLEQRMEDVHAVLNAATSKRAALFGISEGGPMCALFAATYPERTTALITCGSYARWLRDDDCPWAPTRAQHEAAFEAYEKAWGTPIGFKIIAPSAAADEHNRNWWARYLRMGASPGAGVALYRMNVEIDIRSLLPSIRVPTLLLHRTGDRLINVAASRYMAERIPGAKLIELPGNDHLPFFGDSDAVIDEIQEFLTGMRPAAAYDTTLATILFVDIADSTGKAATLGDVRWRDLLKVFHQSVRLELDRSRGRLIDTAGDGVFASFDGPARAIRCACAIRDRVAALGVPVRAGLHTGECQIAGDKLAGVAVHIGARVAARAQPGEVLVSGTVKDLVAGAGLRFSDNG
ncbi:MAG: adenylate/guanylate cyclase domain-containing protein, partial [Betaproteobacteria bacterium]